MIIYSNIKNKFMIQGILQIFNIIYYYTLVILKKYENKELI